MKISIRKTITLASLILLGFIIYFYYSNTGKKQIVSEGEILVTQNAKDFHLSTNGLMIFDNNLYILNKDAELIKTVTAKDIELSVFFANNFAFLYDKDIGRITQYQDTGEFIRNIKLNDLVFDITYENRNIIFHTKYENGERLWSLGVDGKLTKIYETSNSILTYDVLANDKFAVAELKVEVNGYTTICNVKTPKSSKTYTQNSEVALTINNKNSNTILVTNKNIYIFGNEAEKSAQIPNISDVLVIDNSIYLLHSGILSKYNTGAQEIEKHIVAANVNNLEQVSKSIYAYSKTDVAGNLRQRDEFYYRFGSEVEKVELSGIRIATLNNGVVSLYKVTNQRSGIGEINK